MLFRSEANPKVELRWSLPEEGFTVWFDGWVIPKYAKNVKAARYWINFMSRPDVVIRNVDATGYVSSSAAPEVLEYFRLDAEEEEEEGDYPDEPGDDEVAEEEAEEDADDEEEYDYIDVSYFFGDEYTSVALDPVLYPDRADIERSTLEHFWGPKTKDLIEMWSRVKGDNVSPTTWIVIGLTAFAFLFVKVADLSRKARRRRFYEERNKKA